MGGLIRVAAFVIVEPTSFYPRASVGASLARYIRAYFSVHTDRRRGGRRRGRQMGVWAVAVRGVRMVTVRVVIMRGKVEAIVNSYFKKIVVLKI